MAFNMPQKVVKPGNIGKKVAGFFHPSSLKNFFLGLWYAIIDYFKSTYKTMWALCFVTAGTGLVFIYSATDHFASNRTFIMQIIACVLGFLGAIILSNFDYEYLGRIWFIVAGVCLFLVALTFIIGVGAEEREGDKSWLIIAGVSFQPSELMKIGFMLTFSHHIAKIIERGKINSLAQLILLAVHAMIPVGIIAAQGDMGSALIFLFMFIIVMVCAPIKWYYILGGFVGIGAMLPLLWNSMREFQRERIRAVYNPRPGDETTILWQQILSKTAIGSGGMSGQGYLKGAIAQSGRNSQAHNDFIFAVIGEEAGFIGCTVVILLLISIMLICLRVAFTSRDEMGKYICISYFAILASQTLLNIGMCIGVLPVIGITLPFFSAGGSSSMCMYFGIGLVISVFARRNEATLHFT